MKRIIAVTVLLYFITHAFAQEFATRLYTTKDGLKQIQVTSVLQTPDGMIWAGTHGGLSRFDGLKFKNYTMNDGLSSNLVYQLGYWNDTLYVQTRDGIDIFVNGKIRNWFKDEKTKIIAGQFFFNSKNLYLMAHNYEKDFIIDLRKRFLWYFPDYLQNKNGVIGTMVDDHVYIGKNKVLYETNFNDTVATPIQTFKSDIIAVGTFRDSLGVMLKKDKHHSSNNPGPIAYNFKKGENKLVKQLYPAGKKLKLSNDEYIDIVSNTEQGSVFYVTNKGKLIYREGEKVFHFSSNYSIINGFFYDSNENEWVATEKGLLKIFMNRFIYYTPKQGYPDNIWAAAEINDSILLLGSYNGGIHFYKNGCEMKVDVSGANYEKCYMGACTGFNNDLFVCTYPGVSRYIPAYNKLITYDDKLKQPSLALLKDVEDSTILIGNLRTLVSLHKDFSTDTVFDITSIGNYFTIISLAKRNGKILLGLSKGLLEFNPNTGQVKYLNKKERFNSVLVDDRNTVWAATGNGLFIMLNDTAFFMKEIPKDNELSSLIIENNRLFVAGQDVLYVVNLNDYYNHKEAFITYFDWNDGYFGNSPQQNSFFKNKKGELLLPTANNVVKIFPKKLNYSTTSLTTSIISFYISPGDSLYSAIDINKEIIIPPDLNNIKIEFLSINQINPEHTSYKYILKTNNRIWTSVQKARNVSFINLPSGEYQFIIKASSNNLFGRAEATEIHFTILPRFYQKTWFLVVSGLLFVVIIILLLWYVKKREQKKNKGKMEVLKLKNLALTNQMDNHFIVNCTNKITLLFEAGKITEGNKYTRTFSRFLQQNLIFLRKETITLEEELGLIKNYVGLEKIHGRDFTFQMMVDPVVHPGKINIPPFLIQPIVENAIKHGVKMLPAGEGKILITVEQQDSNTIITVQDNGPGMDNTRRKKSDGNRLSMKIVEERIRLMGKGSFVNFVSSNEGTKVIITISKG